MFDANGIEIKTGMVVEVTGAYFKKNNGLFFVTNSAGDPSWSGADHCLTKISKTGKISTAKYNLGFWPICSFVSDRVKAAEARRWDHEHARIEVKTLRNMSEVIEYFSNKEKEAKEGAERTAQNWGQDCETVKTYKRLEKHYQEVIHRIGA